MRFQAIVVSLLASTALATPVRRDVGRAVYTLRLTSSVKSLNGLYLTTTSPTDNNNDTTTTLGVYTNTAQNTPTIKFYPLSNPSTGLSELRTIESGTGSTTLAVVGSNGLLDFASLSDPADVDLPEGTVVDWTSFELDAEGHVEYLAGGGAGRDEGTPKGRWVAFPAGSAFDETEGQGWGVKWKDANAWVTQNYMPVQVVYELVKDE